MATSAPVLLTRFADYSRSPVSRQLALLFGLAASIALGFGVVRWAADPEYQPLYGTLPAAELTQLLTSLDGAGIKYRMDTRSGMLAVPAADVGRARILAASEGLPSPSGIGFESLYRQQELGLSSFLEQARYHRSLEEELARTIAALEGVRGARVHLAMARQTAFLRQREQPSASVVVHLQPGRVLTDRQLAGIVHLISSSVPNMDSAAVSVVDHQGRLMSSNSMEEDFGYTQEQYRLAQMLEQRFGERIVALLEPIVGPGRVRAQVSADIDFSRVERTSEAFSSEPVLRSEQTAEDATSRAGVGGIPGTLSNQPPLPAELTDVPPEAGEAGTEGPSRTSVRRTLNYELDKTVSHVRNTPGSVSRLSVAVVVDYADGTDEEGVPLRVPLDPARIEELTQLVREAVGFSEARGDSLRVINASFVEPPEVEAPAGPGLLESEWLWRAVRNLIAVIGVLVILLVVVRPLVRFSLTVPQAPDTRANSGVPALEGGMLALEGGGDELAEDVLMLAQSSAPPKRKVQSYEERLNEARQLAQEDPQRAASVMKEWVQRDG